MKSQTDSSLARITQAIPGSHKLSVSVQLRMGDGSPLEELIDGEPLGGDGICDANRRRHRLVRARIRNETRHLVQTGLICGNVVCASEVYDRSVFACIGELGRSLGADYCVELGHDMQ